MLPPSTFSMLDGILPQRTPNGAGTSMSTAASLFRAVIEGRWKRLARSSRLCLDLPNWITLLAPTVSRGWSAGR